MRARTLAQLGFGISCSFATGSVAVAGDGALFPVRQFAWPSTASPLDLSAADLDGDGDVDVAATTGSQLLLYRNEGGGDFAISSTNATGAGTVSLTLADVDGDGRLDALTAHQSASSIAWFRNLGGGVFGPANTIPTGPAPLEVAAGDLDGDGDLDLAVAVQGTNVVTLFRNQGGGIFVHQADVPAHVGPRTLAIADLDGDGDRDIALGSSGQGSISVLSNLGGAFAQTFIEYVYSTDPTDVWAQDLDGDGDVDLAFARSSSTSVAILRNQGNATFVTQTIEVGGKSQAVAARDVDGDGDVDLVFAVEPVPQNSQADHLVVLENVGAGNFAAPRTIWTNGGCRAIALGDADNDGFVDAIAGFAQGFDVASGIAGGSFAAILTTVTGQSATTYQPTLRDLDGDLDLDLLSIGGTTDPLVYVWRNDGAGGLGNPTVTTLPSGSCCWGSLYADLEPDGDLDVVVQSSTTTLVTAINDGNANLAAGPTLTLAVRATTGQLADVDGDLDLDYVVATDLPPYDSFLLADHLSVYRNVGGATFQETTHMPMGMFGFPLVLDVDGDLDPDVVFVGRTAFGSPLQMRVLHNDGTGAFAGTWTMPWPSPQAFTSAILADVDGDLDLDILVAVFPPTLAVIVNLGDGTFASPTLYGGAGSDEIASLATADVDDDGDLDVLATVRSNRLIVFRNDGSGAFPVSENYPAGSQNGFGTNLTAGDVDRDGDLDVIVATFDGLVRIDGVHGGATGVAFCSGDGSGTACPCGNSGPAGSGCANSLGGAGTLAAGGRASIAGDTLTLCARGLPPTSSCLYFQGTNAVNGGLGSTFGDGLRCAGGAIVRLGTHASAGGFSQMPSRGDQPISVRGGVLAPTTRHYQTWYRNAASFCTPSTFNLTNGLSVAWVL